MLKNIINNPADWRGCMVLFAASIIIRLASGIEIKNEDDLLIELVNKGGKAISEGGPVGATFVDLFPLVRMLPYSLSWLVPSLKFARDQIPVVRAMHDVPFGMVQDQMKDETAKDSFLVRYLNERANIASDSRDGPESVTDEDLKGAASTLFVAGQDTTWSQLTFFVLAMVYYPDIQVKARIEIESVIGTGRLPEFSDEQNLPYISRVVQEAFRWNLVVPLGIPRVSSKDDEYNGLFIPKGSIVIANGYAIHHDDRIYQDPDVFDPDRFIPKEDGGRGEPSPLAHFGFGRRICPGQHLAYASVWISIAGMLSTLSFSKAHNEKGFEITPDPKITLGSSSRLPLRDYTAPTR
ncbi:hypothetical protein NLG97_g3430 [Lecanicillium saksenae]|uniref:Uncharacterized protein n=1 Tax=Lecanicillium saksenae TaxID=468837 RepID=A0ACC1R0S5_9HYPO|nr:hypothetical protein NLG97_g3430 [Lecanicillium saksenae]